MILLCIIATAIIMVIGYMLGAAMTRADLEYKVKCPECKSIWYKSECQDIGHGRAICQGCGKDIFL